MNNDLLLIACKQGLRISESTTSFDGLLLQKIATVKGFMENAGVSAEIMSSDLGQGTIVLGVSDIFGVAAGDIKFSAVFNMFVTQLALKSNVSSVGG